MRRTALVIAGALLLTACGGGGNSGADSGKVVFWDTSGPNEHPVFEKVAKDCAGKGGYSVDVQQVSFDQALANYKTAAQGGQGPDVLRSDVGWVAQLAQNGLITDLSDTDAAKDTADYLDGPLGSTRYNGKTYAVPQVTDTLALLYNKKTLADAGVRPPATWDELKADAPRLGGANAIFLNNDAYYALPFVYGAGGDLLDVQNKKIVVNSAQNVQALRTAKGLLDAKAATTALDQANSYNNMKAAFSAGQVAMEIDGPWTVVDLLKGDAFKDPSNLGVAVLPGVTAGKGSGPIGGHDYVVRQGTKARTSAVKFIQCMSSTESQVSISKQLGLLPTRKSAYDSPDVKSQPTVTAFEPAIKQAHSRPWVPAGAQLFDQLKIDYAYVLSGQKDAKTALDEVAKTYKDQVVTDYTVG
jgi:arabinogalactan oligomer / maltooligosaccharide transport system substrate-binding protein